jgi:hypothetical protein
MEVNKYQNGKIYKIVCNKTNLVYIGSTTQKYLSYRLKGHCYAHKQFLNGKCRYTTCFKILENNDYYIELVELYPCNSKDELLVRERYYFDNIECVNKHQPSQTKDEKKIKNCQNAKQYYYNNKESRLDCIKKFYTDNKEEIQKKLKKKYDDNKEEILEKRKAKFVCDCGTECRLSDKSRHEKTKKHLDYKYLKNI